MAKALPNSTLDALLDEVATATRLTVCSGEPANYAGIAAVALADGALTSGAFTKADAPGGGRQVTIASQADLEVDATGSATHVAFDDGAALLAVTTISAAQTLTAGNTVTVSSIVLSVSDPS